MNEYNRPLDLQLQQLQPLDGCSSNPWMDSNPRPNPRARGTNPNPSPNPRLGLSLRRLSAALTGCFFNFFVIAHKNI